MIEVLLLAVVVTLLAAAHAVGGLPLAIVAVVAISLVLHRATVRLRGRS